MGAEGGLKEEKEFKCRPRFKGIENFLRRIAFNLGNTPSQTEVKIISCIPIDVTDLQYKIITLERELEDRKAGAVTRRPPTEVNTALCSPPIIRPHLTPPQCCPSRQSLSPTQYSLSRSSRESCCPEENANDPSCQSHSQHRESDACQESPCNPDCPEHPCCPASGRCLPNPPCQLKRSCLPIPTTTPDGQPRRNFSSESSRNKRSAISFIYPGITATKCVPNRSCSPNCECAEAVEDGDNVKNILKKVKMGKRKNRCRTHFVYYAQNMNSNSPFTNYERPTNCTRDKESSPHKETISRSYLADMVRKQYKADKMAEKTSDTSRFSSPVCRDIGHSCESLPTAAAFDAEICSCCRGPYQNIDNEMRQIHYNTFTLPLRNDRGDERMNSVYYDSSLYDVVPVKENPNKMIHCEEKPKKREARCQVEYKNPDRLRKTRIQPCILNCHNVAFVRGNRKFVAKRKLPTKSPNKISPKRRFEQPCAPSNSCSIDCGGVYPKFLYERRRPRTPAPPPVEHRNAECLTISLNNTECQTASTKSVQLDPAQPDENKTEETLNQIKSILQSVLTEVKTNSQVKTTVNEPKRDAVVQKGTSQSNMQACSSLLNSYTYSPYNINPYAPSCSRQSNPYYPNNAYGHLKCMQNYPLFIQTTGRQCACCFKNIPNPGKIAHPKPAATTATNTEVAAAVVQQRSKETEKLIKEIYKSLAVNLDFPGRDTSTSNYEDLKSSSNNSRKLFEFKYMPSKEINKSKGDSSMVIRKKTMQTASTMPIYNNRGFGSNVVSNAASLRSQVVGKTDRIRNERIERGDYLARNQQISSESDRDREKDREVKQYVVELPNATTTTYSDDTESPDTEESDETVVAVEEPKKKAKVGLFTKVCKLFKSKNKKKEKEDSSESEGEQNGSEASDSDDYQTVYSQRSKQPRQAVKFVRERPRYRRPRHSKVSFSRYYMAHKEKQDRARRSPYMEQEYRRHWNENISFHNNSPMYSTDRPVSRESAQQRPRRPVYWQNYEARPTIIQPRTPYQNVNYENTVQNEEEEVTTSKMAKTSKGLAWLKKHKPQCGEQWKKLILEN